MYLHNAYHDVLGYGRFGGMVIKRVIHIGPANSQGGMSSVINTLVNYSPNGFEVDVIDTHVDGSIISKIKKWKSARKKLKKMIRRDSIDAVHIHVTHSMSWWRKLSFMKILNVEKIPFIIHIHSGKFQKFCSSFFEFPGNSFRSILKKSKCKVVVLERRWLKELSEWLPDGAEVINNPFEIEVESRIRKIGDELKIIMLARNSKDKGHDFAIDIAKELASRGIKIELIITGMSRDTTEKYIEGKIISKKWVSEIEKKILIKDAHFMILPSKYEGSSMSIIEAMSNSLPVISSPTSLETIGASELILPVTNSKAWADKIINLMEKEKYNHYCNIVYEQSKKYSPEEISNKWKRIYEEILE